MVAYSVQAIEKAAMQALHPRCDRGGMIDTAHNYDPLPDRFLSAGMACQDTMSHLAFQMALSRQLQTVVAVVKGLSPTM